MEMGPIATWLASLGIPLGIWVLNLLVRLHKERQLTAGGDWLLLLISFDLTGILGSSDLQRYVKHEQLRGGELAAALMALALVAAICWVVSVLYIEPIFATPGARKTPITLGEAIQRLYQKPILLLTNRVSMTLVVFALLVTLTAFHLYVFL